MSIQKEVSHIQEKAVAKYLDGRIVPGSGGTKFDGGDVTAGDFLIECKTTTKDQSSFSIKKEWFDKVKEQAFEQMKTFSALAFRFAPDGQDFIAMDIKTFRELLDTLDKYNTRV